MLSLGVTFTEDNILVKAYIACILSSPGTLRGLQPKLTKLALLFW